MVAEIQQIVARETDPFDPLVISVTGIEGGGAYNVIADKVHLKGTIRSGSEATRQRAQRRLGEILKGVAQSHQARVELKIVRGEPPVVNDTELTRIVSESAAASFGEASVLKAPGWTAADDFGFYSEKRPSVYFRLGIRSEKEGSVYPLHHPKFRVDEAALPVGAVTLAAAAKRFLSSQGTDA
jgi:amidohydrolase